MTLRHLQIFVNVCDFGSMTEAASQLYLAQSAVSLAISDLEKHYGVRLFDRISRRLYLTDAGRNFLGYARHILDTFDEMEKHVQNLDNRGQIRIGASITIGTDLLPGIVTRFQAEHTDIQLRVTIDQSSAIEKMILKNELDLAMIEGLVHEDRILSQDFMSDELVLVCRKGDPLKSFKAVPLSVIKEQSFMLREKGSGTRELFDSVMLTHDLLIVPVWESVSTEAIIRAVEAGIGLSVLPLRLVEKELRSGSLDRIEIQDVEFTRQFHLIYHQDKFLNRAMEAFIHECIQT